MTFQRTPVRLAVLSALLLGVAHAQTAAPLHPNLAHLDFLLIPGFQIEGKAHTGLAIYAAPDPKAPGKFVQVGDDDEGLVDLDDVARAAVVYLRDGVQNSSADSLRKGRELLGTVLALQAEDGEFYNFVFPNGRINRDGPTSRKSAGFWAARGVWALAEGVLAFRTSDPAYARELEAALNRGVAAFLKGTTPKYGQFRELGAGIRAPEWLPLGGADIAAILAVGLAEYVRATPSNPAARTLLGQLAEGIAAYAPGAPDTYPWNLPLPDTNDPWNWHAWGARQVQALALSGRALNKPAYIDAARTAAGQAFTALLVSRGPVEGFTPAPDLYPQIAYGMESIASGLFALADVTGEGVWNELGGVTVGWLLGQNEQKLPLYDPASGRVLDGLERGYTNASSGAESTVTGLLALLGAQNRPAAQAKLGLTRLERVTDELIEAESGSDFGSPPETRNNARASGGKVALLPPGTSLTLKVPAGMTGPYLAQMIAAGPAGAGVRLGTLAASLTFPRDVSTVTKLGRLSLTAGGTLALSSTEKAVQADAVWLFPNLAYTLLGRVGERMLLAKSWSDAAQPLDLKQIPAGATVNVYDRQGRPVAGRDLPAYGFALATWAQAGRLPQTGSAGGPAVTLTAEPKVGNFLPLILLQAVDTDAFTTSDKPLRGNLDNPGGEFGATFPAERGPEAGDLLTVGGVPLRFPDWRQPKNVVTLRGQTMTVPTGRYAALHVLGMADHGNYRATVRLRYADGTEESRDLALSDWCGGPQYSETVAAAYPARRGGNGQLETLRCTVYAQKLAVNPDRELREIVLPEQTTMHVFGLTLEARP